MNLRRNIILPYNFYNLIRFSNVLNSNSGKMIIGRINNNKIEYDNLKFNYRYIDNNNLPLHILNECNLVNNLYFNNIFKFNITNNKITVDKSDDLKLNNNLLSYCKIDHNLKNDKLIENIKINMKYILIDYLRLKYNELHNKIEETDIINDIHFSDMITEINKFIINYNKVFNNKNDIKYYLPNFNNYIYLLENKKQKQYYDKIKFN